MYPPFPQDACFDDLQLQLAPPPAAPPPEVPEDPEREGATAARPANPPLPLWWRVSLIAVAVVLVLVGVAGLFLPGLQGIVTILAGVALLSLVSHSAHRFLQWSLGRWPTVLDKVEGLRLRLHDGLHRMHEKLARRKEHRRGKARAADDAGAGAGESAG